MNDAKGASVTQRGATTAQGARRAVPTVGASTAVGVLATISVPTNGVESAAKPKTVRCGVISVGYLLIAAKPAEMHAGVTGETTASSTAGTSVISAVNSAELNTVDGGTPGVPLQSTGHMTTVLTVAFPSYAHVPVPGGKTATSRIAS